jgi:hypothetical protein
MGQRALVIGLMLAIAGSTGFAPLAAQTPLPPGATPAVGTEHDFEVVTQGIVAFVRPKPNEDIWEAVAVSSRFSLRCPMKSWRTRGMSHEALLIVDERAGPSLHAATKRPIKCASGRCAVSANGLRLRIRDDRHFPPTDSATVDTSDLVSQRHLNSIEGVMVTPEDRIFDHVVNSPEMAVFEIDHGDSLSAEPFTAQTGVFFTADRTRLLAYYDEANVPHKTCLEFANITSWKGHTAGRARLEVSASGGASDDWQPVEGPQGEPLWVGLQNLSTKSEVSSAHFALFGKLMKSGSLPIVCKCENGTPTCHPMAHTIGNGVAVPLDTVVGCGSSGWP